MMRTGSTSIHLYAMKMENYSLDEPLENCSETIHSVSKVMKMLKFLI